MRLTLRDRNPFWLGVGAVITLAALVLVTRFGELGLGQSRYAGEFVNTGELRPGDPVRVAGLDIGQVTAAALEGDHVLVSFRINRDVRLGRDTTAMIKMATLLGGRYLELDPAGAGELPGHRIVLAHTSVPWDLATVIQKGTPPLEQLDPVRLQRALRAVADSLRGEGPKVSAALDGLSRLSAVVVARRDQLAHLITSADTVTQLVNQRGGQIYALLGQSDQLLRELLRRREVIRGLLTDLASLTGQLRQALAENQSEIRPLLDNATQLTAVLRQQDDDVDRALELLAPAGRYLNNALGNGPYLEAYLPDSVVPDNVVCLLGLARGCH